MADEEAFTEQGPTAGENKTAHLVFPFYVVRVGVESMGHQHTWDKNRKVRTLNYVVLEN
jgi:hypothetical protein